VTVPPSQQPLLEVRDLTVEFTTDEGRVLAVDQVSFEVYPGEILGVVGESGSGKSVTAMSILGLVRGAGLRQHGEIVFDGEDLRRMSTKQLRSVRGRRIAMVFQEAITALNPVMTVGAQIVEALRLHNRELGRADALDGARRLLAMVGVPSPDTRVRQYPHELSGGLRQRAMIAMSLANEPRLLIADEPTTALDVTIQAQVLALLRTAQRESHAAAILITHDLGVIAELADRVVVMYAGEIIEQARVEDLFTGPRHPYTAGLLASMPRLDREEDPVAIPGNPPGPYEIIDGCRFNPRCPMAVARCREVRPPLADLGGGRRSACHFHDRLAVSPLPPLARTGERTS
jgi:oligopeptide/dipeptide ABC transporter ATP-binding protein